MAQPTTRSQFKDYCLRKLGATINKVNLSEDQLEDRVDEALSFYFDYHFNGVERIYLKHQLTTDDVNNQYIQIPNNIIGVINVWPIANLIGGGSNNLFDVNFQFILNNMWDFHTVNLQYYTMARQYISQLQQTLSGQPLFRFNRIQERLYLDVTWNVNAKVGDWVIIESYGQINTNDFPNIWGDRWLQNLAVAYIKKQWGSNIKKFGNIQILGGVTLNGQELYDEAIQEIEKIEKDIIDNGMPLEFFIG